MHPRLRQHLLIIAGLWLFLYGSFTLLSPALLDGPDALHAEIAREMLDRGDLITPYANGVRAPGQAPLLFWSVAASFRVFGVGAPQARLPLAVFVLLLAFLVEHFARQAFRSLRAGLYAAVCLLLSPGLFLLTRVLMPDGIATLWLTAAVFCLWLTEHRPGERNGDAPVLPCLGFAAACALNGLTVGLRGPLLAAGIAVLYLLLTRGGRGTLRRITQFHPLLASGVFLIIAAPWHALAAQADPAGSRSHLLRSLLHATGDGGTAPLLPSLCLLPVWTVPWTPFLWNALRAVRRRGNSPARDLGPEQKSLRLLGVAALLPIATLILPGRQIFSIMPSLPFLAMLAGRWLDREAAEVEAMIVPADLGRAGLRTSAVLLVCGAAAALVCAVWMLGAATPAAVGTRWYAHLLAQDAPTLAAIRQPIALAMGSLLLGTLGGWWYRRSFRPGTGNLALAAGALGCLTTLHVAFTAVSPRLSSQQLAASLRPLLHPSNLIVLNGDYASAASLGFYLGRGDLRPLGGTEADPGETPETLRRKWLRPERVFLWTDPVNLPTLPGKVYVIAESGGKQIVSNKAGPY